MQRYGGGHGVTTTAWIFGENFLEKPKDCYPTLKQSITHSITFSGADSGA